jgi:hypothetical protein
VRVHIRDPRVGAEAEAVTRQRHREPLFSGYWQTIDGRRLERATREHLREAARLYWRHKDIRLGWRRA